MTNTPISIPHNALILVGDGRKALFLRNTGTPLHPKLNVERLLQHESVPTSEMGTDRPGRMSGPGASRSAVEQTDWHQLEEGRFVQTLVDALSRAARNEPTLKIVLIAPPKAMGDLRSDLDKSLKGHIVGELVRDLTGHPVHHIEKLLTADLP